MERAAPTDATTAESFAGITFPGMSSSAERIRVEAAINPRASAAAALHAAQSAT
jgi:hypothetical protein